VLHLRGADLGRRLDLLVSARVLVGVGEASYATLSPTIIDDLASDKEKNRFLAIFYVAIPVGSALGFVLGGLLETAYGWRSAFFIAGAPGLALAAAGVALVSVVLVSLLQAARPSIRPAAAMIAKRFMV
jgi:MFS family permease